jgi:uncharacterized phage protein (TIGR02220 family)
MARIRTVKPEFFRNAKLYRAEVESGLPLRLGFEGLWTACDREGRFKWHPDELKLDALPYDPVDFSHVLDALMTRGYLVKYSVGGDWFGMIPSWHKHQFINNRESESDIPHIDMAEEIIDASYTREPPVKDLLKGKGKEGKGKEEEGDIVVTDIDPSLPTPENVIAYLNEKAGKHFKQVNGNVAIVLARIKERYTIDDFKRVIDHKVAKWGKDPKMREYLRPETLFAPKHFESYLNDDSPVTEQNGHALKVHSRVASLDLEE